MIPFQERKKVRKIMESKVTLVALFVALFFVSRGAWNIYQKTQVAISERDIAARDLADLNSRMNELSASLKSLKTENGLEIEVRQKYTVARPGEEIVVVVDDNAKKSENSGVVRQKSFWQRVVSFLGF